MTKKQKFARVKQLENYILSAKSLDESLINHEGVRTMLKERKQLLDSLFLGTKEELAQFNRVNTLFLKYEAKVPELILELKHKTELYMEKQGLSFYANLLTAGVALLIRSNLSIDNAYPSLFYELFWALAEFNQQDDGFVHCYEISLHHPFMTENPEEEFNLRLNNVHQSTGFSHPKLNGVDQWSHTLSNLLNRCYFSIPDVLGLDHGQLFTHDTEFHSFDTNQYYIPY